MESSLGKSAIACDTKLDTVIGVIDMKSSLRQEYDFSNPADVERFRVEHVEANEDAWLSLVGYMEANHDKITIHHAALYKLLENNQELLDRINNRLSG